MGTIDIAKTMTALLADLQADAWAVGIKLVGDVSTGIAVPANSERLHELMTELLRCLFDGSERGTSVSLVTACDQGVLRVEIAAPATAGTVRLKDLMALAPTRLQSCGALNSDAQISINDHTCTVTLSLDGAILMPPPDQQARTVVVVDDDVDIQNFLRRILEAKGFHVISVSDGFDALLVVERHAPSVVLTDIVMPNMDGMDLISRLKSTSPELPVIVISAFGEKLNTRPGSGMPDRVICKPMTSAQVIEAIDAVLC